MDCMELLTYEDRQIIANRLNDFTISHKTPENIEPWLQHWADSKNLFLTKVFDGKLIISENVSLAASEKEKQYEAEQLFSEYNYTFYKAMSWSIFPNWKIIKPKEEEEGYNNYFFNVNNIVSNSLKEEIILVHKHNGKIKKFPANTKLTRFISKFVIAECDDYRDSLEDIIIAISQLHNDKMIEGELCLSIHPMDYMTMSDNECGWESCMSWENDGEFRAGTLEMLTSPCVVVAYIKSSKDMESLEWNNKRWRELFIVHPDLIMGIKGYPYISPTLEALICSKLKTMVESVYPEYRYHNELLSISNPMRSAHMQVEGFPNFDITIHSNMMYNDCYLKEHLGYVTCYIPENRKIYIEYSGTAYDIEGYTPIPEGFEGWLIHPKYDNYVQCAECGSWVEVDDIYTGLEGEDKKLCGYCWEEKYDSCYECGKNLYKEKAIKVTVNHTYYSDTYYYCPEHFDEIVKDWSEEERNYIFTSQNINENEYTTDFHPSQWSHEISGLKNS